MSCLEDAFPNYEKRCGAEQLMNDYNENIYDLEIINPNNQFIYISTFKSKKTNSIYLYDIFKNTYSLIS